MAQNKIKDIEPEEEPKPEKPTKEKGESLFALVERYIRLSEMFEQGVPLRYLPKILFLTLLGILYIGNTHYADRLNRSQEKMKKDVDDLRADYTTLKADYMFESMQSEVEKKVEPLGLTKGNTPPLKLVITPDEY